jgi:putative ABC transport system permease protein
MTDLALKSLLHDKLRFAITVSGVAFAVTLVFVQVGLFLGLLGNASISIEKATADLWVTTRNTPNVDFARLFPEGYVQRVRAVPGVQRADNLIVAFLQVALPSGAEESMVTYAAEDLTAWGLPWNIDQGNVDDLRRGPYFFLDASAAKRFGPFQAGDYREVNGRRLQIVGITHGARSFTTTPLAFMDYEQAQALMSADARSRTSYILVKLAPGADREAVRAEIARRLPHNDVFTREEWARRSRTYWIVSTGLGINMGLTVFLGCLVGIVVVAQTLYTSTMEHLKEFGTVKAIGGSNGDIYAILAKQAAIAAVAGFALGAGMAYATRELLAHMDLRLVIPRALNAWVFAGALALCLASAMVSFRRIARIDPALVFRT